MVIPMPNKKKSGIETVDMGKPEKPKKPKSTKIKEERITKPRKRKQQDASLPRSKGADTKVRTPKQKKPPAPKKYKPSASQREQMSKLRKRAYNKEYRLRKKYGLSAPRPQGTRSWWTKEEFDRQMRALEYYTKRGNYKAVKIGPKGSEFYVLTNDIERIERLQDEANKQRAEFYKGVAGQTVISGGQEIGQTVEERMKMLDPNYLRRMYSTILNPQTFEKEGFTSMEQLQKYIDRLEKQANPEYWENKREQFYQNFVSALYNLQSYSGVSAEPLIQILDQMSIDQFVELYYRASEDLAMVFVNSPPEALARFENIAAIFQRVRQDMEAVMR